MDLDVGPAKVQVETVVGLQLKPDLESYHSFHLISTKIYFNFTRTFDVLRFFLLS